MGKYIDLTGQRFGKLVIIKRAEDKIYSGHKFISWLCKCDCGNEKIIIGNSLRNGSTKSCGCLHKELLKNNVKKERIGTIIKNNQGILAECIEYNTNRDIKIKFLDESNYVLKTDWFSFIKGSTKNPYIPTVCGIGIFGDKYPSTKNNKIIKEYSTWTNMLFRCTTPREKEKVYYDVLICDNWKYYENFYEWLHSQNNFKKWVNYNGEIDKDIIYKGNKLYSPDTCFLVPKRVNDLFCKTYTENERNCCLGVRKIGKQFQAQIGLYGKTFNLEKRDTMEDSFYLDYKPMKEKYIQDIAKEEYKQGNITKQCYELLMNYKVEITD